jgi:hypothetical protein
MKKLLFTLGLFLALGLTAQAQCTAGASAAGKSCCTAKAEKAASTDATIEKRLADDGSVSYVRKESDTQGNVRFVSVKYDEGSNTFVNVAPKTAQAGLVKKTATAEKACAAEGAGQSKACCKSGASAGKACCKAEGAATNQ